MTTVAYELNEIIVKQDYLPETPLDVPALKDNQTKILATIKRLAQTYIESTKALPFNKIHAMFMFTTCRGYEAAYHFYNNTDYNINPNDLFSDTTECDVSESLLTQIAPIELHTNLFNGFQNWSLKNITYCKDNGIDPLEPLLEALNITYSTAINIAFSHLPNMSDNKLKKRKTPQQK